MTYSHHPLGEKDLAEEQWPLMWPHIRVAAAPGIHCSGACKMSSLLQDYLTAPEDPHFA